MRENRDGNEESPALNLSLPKVMQSAGRAGAGLKHQAQWSTQKELAGTRSKRSRGMRRGIVG